MRSIKCGSCGLFNWAESGQCKRCGAELEAPYDYEPSYSGYAQQQQQQQQTYYAPYPSFAGVQMKKKSGLAITSMVFGILSVLPFTLFGFLGIGAITGLILGIVGYKRSKNRPMEYTGGGMAVAGIVLSSFALFIIIPLIFAIAIPNLFASRRAADEASAISVLRTIQSAEQVYQATAGAGRYGSIDDLVRANLMGAEMASGQRKGYRFVVRAEDTSFEATATPVTYGTTGTGKNSFYVAEDGVIRGADRGGMEATAADPPYEPSMEYSESAETRRPASLPVVNEALGVRMLRKIQTGEETYRTMTSDGKYGTMQALVRTSVLDSEMLNPQKSGYNFTIRTDGDTYEAMATPAFYTSGTRSLYIGQDGVIRASDRGGHEASVNDPPYDANSESY